MAAQSSHRSPAVPGDKETTMTAYTLSSRTIIKSLVGQPRKERTVQTILQNGVYFADVPEGMTAEEILKDLNKQAEEEAAFRAQFATEEEYMDYMAASE